nr:MAG: RNA-dependent RNA polymerase [Riboviria sp.]
MGRDRYKKWDTGSNGVFIKSGEKAVLVRWLRARMSNHEIQHFEPCDPIEEGIPLDTSAGQPWKYLGLKKKQEVLDRWDADTLIECGENRLRTERFMQYEFCKVEPCKVTKDVRTIVCYPVDVHLALCKWLLPFSTMAKQFKQCKIGWSKWYNGVNSLRDYLDTGEEGNKFFEMDAKRWDSTIPTDLVELVLGEYFSRFPKECLDDELRDSIIAKITSGFVASSNGEVYWRTCGNSSGNPITSELNTLVHLLMFVLSYYRIYGETETFESMVRLGLYGDDVIGSSALLTPDQFIDSISDLPVKYPKEDVLVQDTIDGLTFLGNKLKLAGHHCIWTPAKPEKMWAGLVNVEKAAHDSIDHLLDQVCGLCLEYMWDGEHLPTLLMFLEFLKRKASNDHPFKEWRLTPEIRYHLTYGLE